MKKIKTRDNIAKIAETFGFRLDVTWASLTDDERENVARAMRVMKSTSVNGVSGYHFNLRNKMNKP